MPPTDPYRLIDETALRRRRRRLWNICLPALPPAAALLGARYLGILPVELGAAGVIAFALLALHLTGVELSRASAARFLDVALGAKDHFLTLATAGTHAQLLPVVAAEAATLAVAPPELPPTSRRSLLVSFILSVAGFLLLWSLPQVASFAAADGTDLDRIAAALEASGDASLATTLREVATALRDPHRSGKEKLAKIAAALQKIEDAQRKGGQAKGSGSSGGSGGKGEQGGESGTDKGQGAGKSPGTTGAQGGAGSAGDARAEAKQELGKLAEQLSSGAGEAKDQQQSQQGENSQPAGGGIQGPESGAKDRKQSERDGTANQPGKNPNESGGNEKPGGNQGQAQAEQGQQDPQKQQNQQNQAGAANQGGAGADGSGQHSTSQGDVKPQERFYKPGEGPDGGIVDGQYVRVRVPEEAGPLPGTEIVAKPGDATPMTPYGNAPLPQAGAPGEVAADQPVPLEYRDALKSRSP